MVVTIVIIIILSTVTISAVVGDNGLIKQAEKTKDIATNSIAKENEDMNRLEQEYANMMGEDGEITPPEPEIDTTPPVVTVTVGGISTNSITVNVQAVDNESGMKENPTYTYYIKKSSEADGSYQPKATDVTKASYTFTGLNAETEYTIKVEAYDKAGNKGENTITVSTEKKIATNVEELKEGDWVNYVDGTGQTRKCVVLYGPENANYSSYGIQIITMDTVKDVTLGNSNFDTSMNSYNNAISTLNDEAMKYNSSTYSSDARCVGSVPNNKNSQAGMFSSSNKYMSSYNGKIRDADRNYETDCNKMKALNIHNIGDDYWLASRNAYSSTSNSTFIVRHVASNGNLGGLSLCRVYSDSSTEATSISYGLRPVFTLRPGLKIQKGDGTQNNPYVLNDQHSGGII